MMYSEDVAGGKTSDPADDLQNEVKRLRKINAALMDYVERSTDQQGNAYSLFQTAINLEGQVKRRTEELTTTLQSLEQSNLALNRAKEIAENANLSKTRFLAAASHDLLQPLNAAHLLMSSLSDLQTGDEAVALASQIGRSLETIDELLRSLLDISRLDAGVFKPQLEDISLAELFESLESDFKPIADQRKLQLRFRTTNIYVLSDRTMLRRVLQNFISNGISYTNEGGVLIGARKRGKSVRLDIVDTGIGIQKNQFNEIFEEFHRGIPPQHHHDALSGGLGLGLAIVSRMLQTLDHPMTFRSVPARGTWFQVSVPAASNPVPIALAENKSADVSRLQGVLGTRILLIENDESVLNAMCDLLKRWHCDTRVAKNLNEAASQLKASDWTPDVIVADQHLDHGDLGSDTIAMARKTINQSVPAIIITADPSDELETYTKDHDIELMYKPVKPAQLRALLAHVSS